MTRFGLASVPSPALLAVIFVALAALLLHVAQLRVEAPELQRSLSGAPIVSTQPDRPLSPLTLGSFVRPESRREDPSAPQPPQAPAERPTYESPRWSLLAVELAPGGSRAILHDREARRTQALRANQRGEGVCVLEVAPLAVRLLDDEGTLIELHLKEPRP